MANFCPNCGNPIREGAAFCANCGTKIASPVAAPAAPAPVAAPAVIENRQEIIAAVTAVCAEEMGKDISALRVISFKKL
jgi:uncharacterized membrane protein YvbJ